MVSTVMQKMQCERDESWFISVAPTDLFFLPTCSSEVVKGWCHSTWEGCVRARPGKCDMPFGPLCTPAAQPRSGVR